MLTPPTTLVSLLPPSVQQIMPNFIKQREAYEVRERPSRTYSWIIFMLSNIIVEIPWNALMAVIIYFCMYYVRPCSAVFRKPLISTR